MAVTFLFVEEGDVRNKDGFPNSNVPVNSNLNTTQLQLHVGSDISLYNVNENVWLIINTHNLFDLHPLKFMTNHKNV